VTRSAVARRAGRIAELDVPSRLECEVTSEPPVAVLSAAGTLDASTTPQLRDAMLGCLAGQPDALLIDARSLTVAGDVALATFVAGARPAAAWPSVPILVCAPRPELAAALRRLGVDRYVAVCASLMEGRVLAALYEQPAQVRDSLPPTPSSARAARALTRRACERWRLPDLVPLAGLVVSELVANVVCHAGTTMDLIITRYARSLHLAVRDYAHRRPPLLRPASAAASGGRGLIIVDRLANGWGWTPTPDGKVIWARLHTHPVRRANRR
jgi:anti-anti-sigma regulatory factor/anti-sigma regulatory factor (Ser/Thr protein kinase)